MGEAFRVWSNGGERVLSTPEVLIAVNNRFARGYLFDDCWHVECYIERGVRRFRDSLESSFGLDTSSAIGEDSAHGRCASLLELAIEKGEAIDTVRHLIRPKVVDDQLR